MKRTTGKRCEPSPDTSELSSIEQDIIDAFEGNLWENMSRQERFMAEIAWTRDGHVVKNRHGAFCSPNRNACSPQCRALKPFV